ncbi:MAG: site-2 protease family protein [Armatimonadetes bacterium]|nr:site-2 protease family protein [Armatimonadota bacterium]
MTPQNEIEEEIRRQMLAERARAAIPPAPETPHYAAPQNPSRLQQLKDRGGIVGALATILLVLAKIGAPVLALLAKLKFLLIGLKLLTFGKILLTGGSMLLSMWVWGMYYGGWKFGVAIVLLIFIHECGHAIAGRLRGIPSTAMIFVPLMGAFVSLKRGGKNVVEDAFIGIMGPIFGTLAGVGCIGVYLATGSGFWLLLALFSFWINLFNLAPMAPLDGGWISPVFSPKLLALGVVLLFVIAPRNPLIWILALLSLPRIIGGWKAQPSADPYYQATASDRWKVGVAYFGLAAFLGIAYLWLHQHLFALLNHPNQVVM